MKALTPVQSLLLLALVGAGVSGWLYGIHWKRVASGDLFSADETLIIDLQDQIASLTEENQVLHERVRVAEGGAASVAAPSDVPQSGTPAPKDREPVILPPGGPILPPPPQKIETH